MFQYRQQLRRWAARTLLLWLFGLAAGVVNACMVVPPFPADVHAPLLDVAGVHLDAGNAALAAADDLATSPLWHHQQGGTSDGQGSLGAVSCKNFCDQAADLVPQQKSALDEANGFALPPPAVQVVVSLPDLTIERAWLQRQVGVLAPSIPIAFLRLTL